MDKRKVTFSLPSFGTRLPSITKLRLPLPGGIYLGGGKLIAASLSTVALGFLAATFLLISTGDQELVWPATGAVYTGLYPIGERIPGDVDGPSHTLQLNLGGVSFGDILFEDMSLGKAGLTSSIQITATSTAFFLECERVVFDNVEAPTFDLANSEIYSFIAGTSTVDGFTYSPTASTTIQNIVSGSLRGTASLEARGGTADRIILDLGSSNAKCATLTFRNVRTGTGGIDVDQIKAGTFEFINSTIGSGSGINNADWIVNASALTTMNSVSLTERPTTVQ